jgi:hypothetical protein
MKNQLMGASSALYDIEQEKKYECHLPFQRFRAAPVNVSPARLRAAMVDHESQVA